MMTNNDETTLDAIVENASEIPTGVNTHGDPVGSVGADGADTTYVSNNQPIDLTQGKPDVIPTNGDISSMKPINLATVLPPKQSTTPSYEDKVFSALDAAVDREKKSISNRINDLENAMKAEYEQAADDAATRKLDESIDGLEPNAEVASSEGYDDLGDDFAAESEWTPDAPQPTHLAPLTEEELEEAVANAPAPFVAEEPNVPGPAPVEKQPESPSEEQVVPPIVHTSRNEPNILDGVANNSLFDDDEEEPTATSTNSDIDDDELVKALKEEVQEKIIKPVRKKFDLSKFTVAKKAENAQKIMNLVVQSQQNIADWVMMSAERPVSVTGLSGPEILKLNPEGSTRNRLNTFRDMYQVVYNHIYDANKPAFETWLKQTRFVDIQHIYFALYRATFNGSNFLTYNCDKCNKVFIKDVPFEDMVVYADDETKEKVKAILKMDSTTHNSEEIKSDLEQISSSYAFAIRTPSIWNVIIETASLSDNFLDKHADLIEIIAYIEDIYYIDSENQRLIPVDTKPVANDQARTSARRIKTYYDIINSLSSEDYYALRSLINNYDSANATKLSYQIPACTCPHCAAEIPADKEVQPDSMLFMRHQLAAFGNM